MATMTNWQDRAREIVGAGAEIDLGADIGKTNDPLSLVSIGITGKQSSRWQRAVIDPFAEIVENSTGYLWVTFF